MHVRSPVGGIRCINVTYVDAQSQVHNNVVSSRVINPRAAVIYRLSRTRQQIILIYDMKVQRGKAFYIVNQFVIAASSTTYLAPWTPPDEAISTGEVILRQ